MSHRSARIGDQIRRELARLLREEMRDPRIGFVTLTDVVLSPDLKHARVYFTTMSEERETVLGALRRATPFLRRSLAKHCNFRFTPQLRFAIDEAFVSGLRVDRLLQKIADEEKTEEES
jgi:ribosome-binding factor A